MIRPRDLAARRGGAASRLLSRLLVIALGLLAATTCVRDDQATDRERAANERLEQPRPGGVLRVPVATDPASLNPLVVRRGRSADLWPLFYPSLFVHESRGAHPPEVRGDLARRWSWSEQDRALRVVLRRDRYWQDTTRVRAADVHRTYEAYRVMGRLPARALNDTIPDPGLLAVEQVDDSTLVFRFRPGFPSWRIWPVLGWPVLPEHKLGELSASMLESGHLTREPLSAGPFRLLEWRPGLNLLVESNPLYKESPWLRRVLFEPCPGVDARILRLELGEADLVTSVPVFRLRALIGEPENLRVHRQGVASVEMLFWNLGRHEPRPEIREAASLAVNRERLVSLFVTWRRERFGGPAGGVLEPAGPVGNDSLIAIAPMPRFDPRAADSLLDAAGWIRHGPGDIRMRAGAPLRIEMLYDRGDEFRERLATHLEEDFAHAGILLQPVPLDGSAVWQRFRAGQFETALVGFRPPSVPDVAPLWASWGFWNGGRYASARTDSLIRAQGSAETDAEVARGSRLIEAQIRLDKPVTFLIYREGVDLLAPRVRGYESTPSEPWRGVARAWLADTTSVSERRSADSAGDLPRAGRP